MIQLRKIIAAVCFILLANIGQANAQSSRWQQKIRYDIDVTLDVQLNRLFGTEKIRYWNHSPDTLKRLFFHLYWNAFQPNSSMDARSRDLGRHSYRNDKNGNPIPDWDARVKDRISKLDSSETGFCKVDFISIGGKKQKTILHETILEVVLDKPIPPVTKNSGPVLIDVAFVSQVPVQIRRAGRDNAEGIRYSMSQWFPKMAEYDAMGWHANQYIAREFYGVWGDFNVNITLHKDYMVAATGELQNALQIGMGYTPAGYKPPRPAGEMLTWKFKAVGVHDFVWAADPGYVHEKTSVKNGPALHVFYKPANASADSAWQHVLFAADKMLPYIEKRFGKYPWPTYSFIQGGDGGMEYAMATLLKGPGIGTVIHEWMHSWYQQLLGINEALYPWMDEGFTNFAENEVYYYYLKNIAPESPWLNAAQKQQAKNELAGIDAALPFKQAGEYKNYFNLAASNLQEPLSTHADHFNTNVAYGISSYSKGSMFLTQLGYLIGDSIRDVALLDFYRTWKFKHPDPNDFIRIAEMRSGLMLQWFRQYWIETTKTIDYSIAAVQEQDGVAAITLKRNGLMPMPLDVLIVYKDGSEELHYVPLDLLLGKKQNEGRMKRVDHDAWRWTHPEYVLRLSRPVAEIKEIDIDPTQRMADVNRKNNRLVVP